MNGRFNGGELLRLDLQLLLLLLLGRHGDLKRSEDVNGTFCRSRLQNLGLELVVGWITE